MKLTAILMAGVLLFAFLSPESYAKSQSDYKSSYSSIASTSAQIHQIFPNTYWASLDALLKAHPNWRFQAFNTGLSWNECFDGSYWSGESEMYYGRNLLEGISTWGSNKGSYTHKTSWYSTDSHYVWNSEGKQETRSPFNWAQNSWVVISAPNWIQASEPAVRYCMDPRNFLNEEQIFQFEDMLMSPTSPHPSLAEVESVFKNVSGSDFWVKSANDTGIVSELSNSKGQKMTYAQAIYAIGEEISVNPVFIASRIVQEQGLGQSPLISGTRAFTVTSNPDQGKKVSGGYYNYFNIEATDGSEGDYELIYNNGLTEAYHGGWNTRFKALLGGATKLKTMYLDRGQRTYYFQKFCVDSTSNRCMWGQYMGSLTTPQREAAKAYKGYTNGGNSALNATHLFVIPVFSNMPSSPEPMPTKDGNPNYKIGSIYVNGKSIADFKTDTTTYKMSVASNVTTVRFNIHPYAPTSVVTLGSLNQEKKEGDLVGNQTLLVGDNVFNITCKAENGDTRTYKLTIHRDVTTIKYGDIDADGSIDVLDINYILNHIIGKKKLSGSALEAADVDADGSVDIMDINHILSYIVGRTSHLPR